MDEVEKTEGKQPLGNYTEMGGIRIEFKKIQGNS
jgi:hypothetical protein